MMGCQLSCLLDGEGFPRKKKKKSRTRQGRDALALNQFFFLRGPLLSAKTRRAYPTFATWS